MTKTKCSNCGTEHMNDCEVFRCQLCGKQNGTRFPSMENSIEEINSKAIQNWKDCHTEDIIDEFILWYINPRMEHTHEDIREFLENAIKVRK